MRDVSKLFQIPTIRKSNNLANLTANQNYHHSCIQLFCNIVKVACNFFTCANVEFIFTSNLAVRSRSRTAAIVDTIQRLLREVEFASDSDVVQVGEKYLHELILALHDVEDFHLTKQNFFVTLRSLGHDVNPAKAN